MNIALCVNLRLVGLAHSVQLVKLAIDSFPGLGFVNHANEDAEFDQQVFDAVGVKYRALHRSEYSSVRTLVLIGRNPQSLDLNRALFSPDLVVIAVPESGVLEVVSVEARTINGCGYYSNWFRSDLVRLLAHHGLQSQVTVLETLGFYTRRFSTISGPASPNGFRCAEDPSRARYQNIKNSEHVKILFLGGSQLHGDGTHATGIFTSQLERRFNERLTSAGLGGASVINFGLPGFNQEDELALLLNKARFLRPDIIVSHSGWNDLIQGLLCPPDLISDSGAIPNVLRLTKRLGIDPSLLMKKEDLTSLDCLARAYVETWLDFFDMTKKLGSRVFLKVLQPSPSNKSINCIKEREAFTTFIKKQTNQNFYEYVFNEYENFVKLVTAYGLQRNMNCFYCKLPSEPLAETNFYDAIHLSSTGHTAVADYYDRLLSSTVLEIASLKSSNCC